MGSETGAGVREAERRRAPRGCGCCGTSLREVTGKHSTRVTQAPEIPFGASRWVKTQGAGRWLDKGLVKAGTLNAHKKGTRMDGGTEVNS